MAERRLDPPRIPNAEYIHDLGSGGFADVFLYHQEIPSRHIAVKVLRYGASSEQNGAFEAEANLMAQMSTHPSILSVYGAGVSDDGRSYLMMEYCPPPHLGKRARQRPFRVPRVLDMGIRIAGAVETLHRAHILHRDIKPSNILVTQFGHPVITDFGIAVPFEEVMTRGGTGFSVPWAAPEQQSGGGPFGPALDVYSLSATIYTMLTGRSPFEVPGGDNSEIAMVTRVLRSPVPRINRKDVPVELERVLAIGMAKDPDNRYPSAMDLAVALQEVQTDMHQRPTQVDVIETDLVEQAPPDDDDLTRARPLVAIDLGLQQSSTLQTVSEVSPEFAPPEDSSVRGEASRDQATTATSTENSVELSKEQSSGTKVITDPTPDTGAETGNIQQSTDISEKQGDQREEASQIPSNVDSNNAGTQPGTLPQPQKSSSARWIPVSPTESEQTTFVPQKPSPSQQWNIRNVVAAIITLAIVVGVAFGLWMKFFSQEDAQSRDNLPPSIIDLPVTNKPPEVTSLRGELTDKGVVFTWDAMADDAVYLYRVVDPVETYDVRRTKETTTTVDKVPGRTCLEVVVLNSAGKGSTPVVQCVETP